MRIKLTEDLAEFLGIIVGDGYIRLRKPIWLSIECAAHERPFIDTNVVPLLKSIFNIETRPRYFSRKGYNNTYGIVVCNRDLVHCLEKFDVAVKHDIIDVPKVVLNSKSKKIKSRFLRGYIDTDGCLSFISKNGKYTYPRLNVSSVSYELLFNTSKIFNELGFTGSFWKMKIGKKSKLPLYRFEVKGPKMIDKWFTQIGTKNSSTLSKYIIWKNLGECKTNLSFDERIQILKSNGLINSNALVAQFG